MQTEVCLSSLCQNRWQSQTVPETNLNQSPPKFANFAQSSHLLKNMSESPVTVKPGIGELSLTFNQKFFYSNLALKIIIQGQSDLCSKIRPILQVLSYHLSEDKPLTRYLLDGC